MRYLASFYVVNTGDEGDIEGETATATLADARKVRAACYPGEGEVRRVWISAPLRNSLARVFNRTAYAAKSEVVLPPKPERPERRGR